jgi:hypothetical protein
MFLNLTEPGQVGSGLGPEHELRLLRLPLVDRRGVRARDTVARIIDRDDEVPVASISAETLTLVMPSPRSGSVARPAAGKMAAAEAEARKSRRFIVGVLIPSLVLAIS